MAEIILPPVPPRPKPAIRPTMIPVLEEPDNRGTKILMIQGPGSEPGPPGPTYAPLEIADNGGSNWLDGNVYEVGETVDAKTATYVGGKPPVEYRYRWGWRKDASDDWEAEGPWFDTVNEKTEVSLLLTKVGQVNLLSQATDSSNTYAGTKVNSYTGPRNVSEPITTVWGSQWVTKDPFIANTTAIAKTAEYAGGKDPVTYRYRTQQRLTGGDGTISNGDWFIYNNTVEEVDVDVPAAGYDVRFHSNASDSNESNNEFTGWKQVQPQATIGTIVYLVNGIEAANNACTAVSGSSINVDCTTAGGTATDMTYFWKIRSGNASITGSTSNRTCSVSIGNEYPGSVQVQCTISSANSSNSPVSDILTVVLVEAMTVSTPQAY